MDPPPPDAPPTPPAFAGLGGPQKLAAGTTLVVQTPDGSDLTGIEFTSTDPDVAVAKVRSARLVEITSLAPGTVRIEAHHAASTHVLDSIEVTAAPVAAIEVVLRAAPGADAPIEKLAGLAGGTDAVCVRYRDRDGALLHGRGQFTATGALTLLPDDASGRISEAFAPHSTCVQLAFARGGTGQLVASVRGGIVDTIPVDIVAGAASLHLVAMVLRDDALVVAPDPVVADEPIALDVIGKTADGVPIAGLAAQWLIASGDVIDNAATEFVFAVPAGERATVSATAGVLVASYSVTGK